MNAFMDGEIVGLDFEHTPGRTVVLIAVDKAASVGHRHVLSDEATQ